MTVYHHADAAQLAATGPGATTHQVVYYEE